ncbi:hypothetical protein DFH09DRAFT_1091717 [Mycena vulgaris]|nr:hypothetical protein DFH09DRAFT_1091717 [Mycena vulgaris]
MFDTPWLRFIQDKGFRSLQNLTSRQVTTMLNALWQFLFPSKTSVETPPLKRPRKYPRTTDPAPDSQRRDLRANEDRLFPPGSYLPPRPQFYGAPPGFHPSSFQNQPNHQQGYYGGFGLNPWIANGPAAHHFGGYPDYQPLGFNPLPNPAAHYPCVPVFAPPNYPPPGFNRPPAPPFHAPPGQEFERPEDHPVKIGTVIKAAEPPPSQVQGETYFLRCIDDRPNAHKFPDHSNLSAMDWPTGFVWRESVKSRGERKWKHTKWAWRSNGVVQHQGYAAEVRGCLGVFRCGSCQRLTRPKTQASDRRIQIQAGCTSRTCPVEPPLLHDECEARAFHYNIQRDAETILVWEHSGDHSTHARPPGGRLSKAQETQVDAQVMRKQDASAHALRTGDPGPGSVLFPDISDSLAAPGAARYALGQSQARLGITTGSTKGGLAFMSAFADLNNRFSTPFIIDSGLSGPVYLTLQTPFMDEIIREAVESWIVDLADGPGASRHGFVIDGDHSFFRQGPLLATCAFSTTSREWTPILYSWINGLDTAHHRPHFRHIFQSIIKHAGDRFTRKLLLCVMDFSGAQRGAHAEEYADTIIGITPGFATLSKEAQAAERRHLVREAEEAEVGCEVHFWRSADHVKKTHSLVPPELANTFEKSLRELLSPTTTSERFDAVILALKTTFPAIKNWVGWWERRSIASMIFPAKSAVDRALAAKVPSTSNPIEHQHSLLHHAVGKDQELLPGIEKIYLHVREMEKKFDAIKAGHFNAGEVRDRRPRKIRGWDGNDGRAPDTVAALAAAATNQAPPPPPTPPSIPPPTAVIYSPRQLRSYPWDRPNSCFFDNGLEFWFRSFSKWSGAEQAGFLGSLPPNSALATFFFHFQQRLKWIATPSATDIQGTRVLSLGRHNTDVQPLGYIMRSGVDVKLHFGVLHIWSGSCPSQHNARVGVGSVQDLLRINLFDLRVARRKRGPATSLTEYFAHCTPRVSPGNDEGGTTVVHSLPQPVCAHLDCAGSQLLELAAIDTLWPKILQINPECGTEPRLPIDRTFSIDGADGLITYELTGTVSFDAPRKHWTSKILIGDTTFHYDDLVLGGSLVAQGPADLISTPDRRAVLWIYHRSSKFAESTTPLLDVVSKYDAASEIDASRPRRSPSVIRDSASPKLLQDPPPPNPGPPVIPEGSQDRFHTPEQSLPPSNSGEIEMGIADTSFAETNSHTPCPLRCDGCEQEEPEGDNDPEEVQCEKCRFWSHIKCLSEAHWDDPDVHFICKRCLSKQSRELFDPEQIVMVPFAEVVSWQAPDVLWYPAKFVARHPKYAGKPGEYEFVWLTCNDGTVYNSEDSMLPALMLRRFVRSHKFCTEIGEVQLTDEKIGNIRLPSYMEPDNPDHENPALTEIFNAAIPQVAKILAEFDKSHPVVGDFHTYFAGKKPIERSRGVSKWMATFGLIPTPELEAVISDPLISLLIRRDLSHLREPERNARVLGVGSALLQLLAVQNELGEELDLNGDLLADLRNRAVVPCPSDGVKGLNVMFSSIPLSSSKSGVLIKQMLRFNHAHTIYDTNFRPPTFRRDEPSYSAPRDPIPITLKRKADNNIDEKRPEKRLKKGKVMDKDTKAEQRLGSQTNQRRKLRSGKSLL